MKLSELVPCWGLPESLEGPPEAPAENRRSDVTCRVGSSRSAAAAAAWRPSLGAICEDGVTSASVAPERLERRSGCRKESAGKARPAATRAETRARDHRDRFGQVSMPTVIPAFTPTAFLF